MRCTFFIPQLSYQGQLDEIVSSKTYSNGYIEDNLSFSTQMKYKSDERVSGLFLMLYSKPFRYNLHRAPKSLFIDIGNNKDTLEEVTNAIYPFVDILSLEKLTK